MEPQSWAMVDYATLESPDVSGEVTWTAARTGTGHGLIVWFDSVLAEGVHFSNGPDAPELIYGSAFFPWLQPVTIAIGDSVSVALRANLVGEEYNWRWDACVLDQGNPGRINADFRQSTFLSAALSPVLLRKLAATHVPTLNEDSRIDRLILELMENGTSLGDIANRVFDRFCSRFARWEDALNRVGELSEKYSQ